MRPHSSPKFKKRQLILSHIGNTRSEHLWEQREQEREEDTRHDCNVEPKSSIKITPGATVWNADCEEIAPLLNRRYNDHFWICSCQVCIRSWIFFFLVLLNNSKNTLKERKTEIILYSEKNITFWILSDKAWLWTMNFKWLIDSDLQKFSLRKSFIVDIIDFDDGVVHRRKNSQLIPFQFNYIRFSDDKYFETVNKRTCTSSSKRNYDKVFAPCFERRHLFINGITEKNTWRDLSTLCTSSNNNWTIWCYEWSWQIPILNRLTKQWQYKKINNSLIFDQFFS